MSNSIRGAEKRMARIFAANGRDPHYAAATVHARLNRQRRAERVAAVERAVSAIDTLAAAPVPAVPPAEAPADRWCRACGDYHTSDPCEECNRHMIAGAP